MKSKEYRFFVCIFSLAVHKSHFKCYSKQYFTVCFLIVGRKPNSRGWRDILRLICQVMIDLYQNNECMWLAQCFLWTILNELFQFFPPNFFAWNRYFILTAKVDKNWKIPSQNTIEIRILKFFCKHEFIRLCGYTTKTEKTATPTPTIFRWSQLYSYSSDYMAALRVLSLFHAFDSHEFCCWPRTYTYVVHSIAVQTQMCFSYWEAWRAHWTAEWYIRWNETTNVWLFPYARNSSVRRLFCAFDSIRSPSTAGWYGCFARLQQRKLYHLRWNS